MKSIGNRLIRPLYSLRILPPLCKSSAIPLKPCSSHWAIPRLTKPPDLAGVLLASRVAHVWLLFSYHLLPDDIVFDTDPWLTLSIHSA